MIYLYYSDSKEKDLVDSWAKYGTKMGFVTITSDMSGWSVVSSDCGSALQYCTSTDTRAKNVSYDTLCTSTNTGKLSVDYNKYTITQDNTGSLYPWNYQTNPVQLEAEHRKVKQIIKFKPI
jgi:hypothetical protein